MKEKFYLAFRQDSAKLLVRRMNNKQQTAIKIAVQIKEMLESKRILARTEAPIQPADILILVQARRELVNHILQQLAINNIPNTGIDRLSLNDNIAVWDMLALMQFLCNNHDDMSLACALLSPIFGVDYDMLTSLCYNRGAQTLFSHIAKTNEELHQKLRHFMQMSQTHIIPSHFITQVLYGEGYMQHFNRRLGEVTQDVLQNFIYQAQNYEHAHLAPNLYGFVNWVRLVEGKIKRDPDAGGNKVRIMTVHGAKGLEAPIVILADSDRPLKMDDKIIIYDDAKLPLMLAMNGGQSKRYGLFAKEWEAQKELRLQEYWRLLYVALTRAADELHIFATAKKAGSWYEKLLATMQGLSNVVMHDDGIMEYVPYAVDINQDVSRETFLPQLQKLPQPPPQPSRKNNTERLPVFSLPINKPPIRFKSVTSMLEDNKHAQGEINFAKLLPKLKGNLIHALLELQVNVSYTVFLSSVPIILPHIAKRHNTELSAMQTAEIMQSLNQISNNLELVKLLESPAFAELPMVGYTDDFAMSAQVDRVIIDGDNIYIIDFKTGDASNSHDAQLTAYKTMLQPLYPNHHIATQAIYI